MEVEAMAELRFKPMTQADVALATELSREQSWPHREEDWSLFLQLGEGVVAELNGAIVGTIMGWRFGDDKATLGMIIVTPQAQGRGIGRKMMEQMLESLGDRTIILNATEEGLPLYRKMGFVEIGMVYQHQGRSPPTIPIAELQPGERVRPMGQADGSLPELYSLANGIDRSQLFEALADDGKTVVLDREHEPVGFGMMRRFGRGWAIAPVVAPDLPGAKALITHWLCEKARNFCRIDVSNDDALSQWLEDMGLPRVGSVRTMVKGEFEPNEQDARLFAVAAQALG